MLAANRQRAYCKILKLNNLQITEKYFHQGCKYQKKVYFCSLKFKEKKEEKR